MSVDAMSIERAKRVSVVIPVYGRSESIYAAVQSALAQTMPPGEIIVIDDGSQPAVAARDLAAPVSSVRVIRHERNRGAAAARQTGIDAARGDYIAFLDSDDIWFCDKLEKQVPLLPPVDEPLVAVACGWEAVDDEGNDRCTRIPISSADPRDFASGCWFAPGSTTIVPKRAFEIVGGFDPDLRRLEDLDWFLRFALAGGRLEVAPVVGAEVATGRRATIEAVDASWERLSKRFGRKLDLSCARRLRAYLLLERAAARRNSGNSTGMAWFMLRSFLTAPRLSLHLRRWWD